MLDDFLNDEGDNGKKRKKELLKSLICSAKLPEAPANLYPLDTYKEIDVHLPKYFGLNTYLLNRLTTADLHNLLNGDFLKLESSKHCDFIKIKHKDDILGNSTKDVIREILSDRRVELSKPKQKHWLIRISLWLIVFSLGALANAFAPDIQRYTKKLFGFEDVEPLTQVRHLNPQDNQTKQEPKNIK